MQTLFSFKFLNPGWTFSFGAFLFLLLPSLVQNGMFVDGLTYAAISNNMAGGWGTWFAPHYSQGLYPIFYEHPPLVFILQSFWFELLGPSFLTERVYCLTMALLSGFFIWKIWKIISPDTQGKTGYIPLILWLSIPLVPWGFRSNLLEITMGLFCLMAVFFLLESWTRKRPFLSILAGLFIYLAFLSKGFPALFPLALPVILGFFFKRIKRGVTQSILVFAASLSFAALSFILFPGLMENLSSYFNQQLVPALNNEREITTKSHFNILLGLLNQIVLPLLLSLLIWVFARKKARFSSSPWLWIFLALGLSASLPLMVTLKQRSFYLIPAFPYFALALSLFIHPYLNTNWPKKWSLAFKTLGLALGVSALIWSGIVFGQAGRDEHLLHDAKALGNHFPPGTLFEVSQDLSQNYQVIAYLSRYAGISTMETSGNLDYLLVAKKDSIPERLGYTELENLNLEALRLYVKDDL